MICFFFYSFWFIHFLFFAFYLFHFYLVIEFYSSLFYIWQLVIETKKLFNDIVVDLDVSINYLSDGMDHLPIIFYYMKTMCISLWDTAFFRDIYKEIHVNHNNDKQFNFKPTIRRVFYRYFKYVIFHVETISKSFFFFANYLDIKNEECMFIKGIMKSWDSMHFEKCGWYLDYLFKTPFTFNITLRDSIQLVLKGAKVFQRHSNSSLNYSKTLFIFACNACRLCF